MNFIVTTINIIINSVESILIKLKYNLIVSLKSLLIGLLRSMPTISDHAHILHTGVFEGGELNIKV